MSFSVSSLPSSLGRKTLNARSTAFDLSSIFFEQVGGNLLFEIFEIEDGDLRGPAADRTTLPTA